LLGIILMAAGALGLVLSLLFWSSFSPYRRGAQVAGAQRLVAGSRRLLIIPSGLVRPVAG
jgi:hypothetical protein